MTQHQKAPSDLQRERWRRARAEAHLEKIDDPQFAIAGPAARVRGLSVRMLILPPDPEDHRLDFDDAFLGWWLGDHEEPISGNVMEWGPDYQPTPSAAVRHKPLGDDEFYRYVAVGHDGSLDACLGVDGAWRNENTSKFWLLTIVGRLWNACHLYSRVASRFKIDGPCQVTLALRKTNQAILGGFAEGWAEPQPIVGRLSICSEANLLMRREVYKKKPNWPQQIAFSLGAQIEDAFGSKLRRFKAHSGQYAGEFDRKNYIW